MYASEDFANFVNLIRIAKNPRDVFSAWTVLKSPYTSLRVITALPDYSRNVVLRGVDIRDLSGKKIVTPYFLSDSLYFSSRALIEKTLTENKVRIPIDGSIMLDTNIASYISTYIHRRSFGQNQNEIVGLIRQLLEKNPNFDYVYYMVENSKKFIEKFNAGYRPNSDQFWEEIDKGFKENLVALRLFLSIDNEKFKHSGSDAPTISVDEAEKEAKDFAYEFYFDGTKSIIADIDRRFTYARILLCKMASVNFTSSEGYKKKSIKFVHFMMDKLGIYFDREMHLAIRYFQEGKRFSFFEKLDKGKHIGASSVKEKISNMAWDLIVPRFVESLSARFGQGEYFIPHYLTWDGGLNESLNMYKAKACLYDDSLNRIVTISEVDTEKLLRNTIGDFYANQYFELKAVENRLKVPPKSLAELKLILEDGESELISIIQQ